MIGGVRIDESPCLAAGYYGAIFEQVSSDVANADGQTSISALGFETVATNRAVV